jgi:hypothetical protein
MNGSGLGVGVAVVLAEARMLDSVRDHSFRDCMEAAGWELRPRDESADQNQKAQLVLNLGPRPQP